MCGIAGIFGLHGDAKVNPADIDRMCSAIVHRGPDDQGMHVDGRVGLGVRRLSIIDLLTGHQPVHNEDKSVWVVVNGEIYNYLALRQKLEVAGHRFYTHSDTEVVCHLYEDYGVDFVGKLRGMFAIALYDERRQKLVLARDRLGKKPLVYASHAGYFYFGSEIRSLLAVAPELADVDGQGLLSYLNFGYIPDPLSSFKQIRKLPAGHVWQFEAGKVTCSAYWDIPAYAEDEIRSEEEWLELLESELAESVRMRLISDVPLGVMLSGGVDSSTVVALMARASSKPVKSFSIAFSDQNFDEGPFAREVAERFGTEHHELVMQPDVVQTVEEITQLLEEPFGDSSMLPTYHISRLIRQHVTVALAGDGGDELFAGYDRYSTYRRRQRFRFWPQWAGTIYRDSLYPMLPGSLIGRRFLYNMSLSARDGYIDSISFFDTHSRDSGILTEDFLAWAHAQNSPQAFFQAIHDDAPAVHPLSKLLFLDTKTYLVGDILAKVDRMSMANSLEVRAPMLDHVFVELATRIPADWKLRKGQSKYILKKLAERVGVPRNVIYRPKQGFSVPLARWFRKELTAYIVSILTDNRTLQRGYFRRAAIEELLSEHMQGKRDRSAEIWILFIFELWHRNFLESARWRVPISPLSGAVPFSAN